MSSPAHAPRRSARFRLIPAGALLALIGASCAEGPQNYLNPEGPIARQLDSLWDFTFGVAVVIFFLVQGALLYAIFRFRRRTDDDRPVQTHHNTKLEITWTLIPVLLLAGVAVPTLTTLFDISERPEGALEIKVTGFQWWWEYDYGDLGVVTANEMHIPINRPVYLTLESSDVIHSFWVPKLAGKQDVVPGHTEHMTILADEPGEYFGQCAEFCGLSHANMRLRVFAHTPEEFDRWVSEQSQPAVEPTGLAAQGRTLFLEGACAGCHAIEGTTAAGTVGPNLTHFASRTTFAGAMFESNHENLISWVSDAPSMKPGSKMPSGLKEMGFTAGDVEALVAYLEALK